MYLLGNPCTTQRARHTSVSLPPLSPFFSPLFFTGPPFICFSCCWWWYGKKIDWLIVLLFLFDRTALTSGIVNFRVISRSHEGVLGEIRTPVVDAEPRSPVALHPESSLFRSVVGCSVLFFFIGLAGWLSHSSSSIGQL